MKKIKPTFKIKDKVFFVKKQYTDIFSTKGNIKIYSCETKEMILKGIVKSIDYDMVTIQLVNSLTLKNIQKEHTIHIGHVLPNKTIPGKLLGIWK